MMRKTKIAGAVLPTREKPDAIRRCGECGHCVPVTAFHTLTVHGGQPTLGVCPYVEERKVLLSEMRKCRFFVKK